MTTIKGVLIPAAEDTAIELVEIERGDNRDFQKYVGRLRRGEPVKPHCSVFVHDEGVILGSRTQPTSNAPLLGA